MVATGTLLIACASSQSESLALRHKAATSRDVLRAAEIGGSHDNAYEALNRLRPEYLRLDPSVAGTALSTAPSLYVDGARVELDVLRHMPASWIIEVRFVRAANVAVQYRDHRTANAIFVKTDVHRRSG